MHYPIGVLISAPFRQMDQIPNDMKTCIYSHNNISRNIIPHFSPHTPLPACYELSVASCVSKNNNTDCSYITSTFMPAWNTGGEPELISVLHTDFRRARTVHVRYLSNRRVLGNIQEATNATRSQIDTDFLQFLMSAKTVKRWRWHLCERAALVALILGLYS